MKYQDASCGCGAEVFNYTYSNYLKQLESRSTSTGVGGITYSYDGAGRLAFMSYPEGWVALSIRCR